MSLIEDLHWRYATKKMSGEKVSQEKVDTIIEAARLAPSSSGLQPYEIISITNKDVLEKIKAVAMNQNQITDCSHLLVFAAWDGYSFDRIGDVLKRTAVERGLPENAMEDYHKMLWATYEPLGTEWHQMHSAKQAYIAFGMAIAEAAELKVDATPMEGFVPAEVDEILELSKKGLKSVLLLPLGYRAEEGDWLVNMKKIRTSKENFVTEIN